jgi:hypothetical protein
VAFTKEIHMLIGLTGKAYAGKDTSADYLVKQYCCVKIALADPLKRIVKDVFSFTDEQLWGPSEMRNEPDERYPRWVADVAGEKVQQYLTPRYALQQLGTEWGRDCYNDVWIDYALRMANEVLTNQRSYGAKGGLGHGESGGNYVYTDTKFKGVVISDCRFMNEFAAIRKDGGKVWRIKRPEEGLEGDAGLHVSETEQDGVPDSYFDAVLYNDSTIAALQMRIDTLMKGP